ncbi:MAG: flagellin [Sneathiella sp.]
MAFSVNTNGNAMAALRSLSSTQSNLSTIQEQIQSGLKIGSATDDPSTFVIAQGMRGDIGGLKAVQEGLNFGTATVNMGLAAATQISDQLTDMQAKVTQALNEGLDPTILQSEANEMVAQIETIVASAEFNGINLLDNGGTSTGLNVLTGLSGSTLAIGEQNATTAGLGVAGLDLTAEKTTLTLDNTLTITSGDTIQIAFGGETHIFEFYEGATTLASNPDEGNGIFVHGVQIDTTSESFSQMMGNLAEKMRSEAGLSVNVGENGVIDVVASGQTITTTQAITGITDADGQGGGGLAAITAAKTAIGSILTTLGTSANRLESQANFTQILTDKIEEGLGILVDANLAETSAKLQSEQTKEQLGIQSLSIANAASQSILGLFR